MPLWKFLENGGLRAVLVGHRRWGKDDCALHFTSTALHQRIGNYWHMLPKYEQARKAVWDAINPHTGKKRIDEAFPRELRKSTNNVEMKIEFKSGSIWQLVGSDNFNMLVGSPPIGLVMSEYALANPQAWGYLSPILAENGGFALFIFTSRGNNHGKLMYLYAKSEPGWFAQLITVEDSPVFTPEQLEQIHREYLALYGVEMGEALFQQEYYCSFEGAQLGAYYSKQLSQARTDQRIGAVPHVAGHEVYTAWDLGVDDSTTIWMFQTIGQQIRFVDYYEATGEGLSHYAKMLKEKPYVYGDHYLPHDVEVRELGTGKSRREVLEELGIRSIVTVQRARDIQAILNGIEAGRNILSQCWFDEQKCRRGLMALESYHAEYNDEKKKLDNRPEHDWTSHAADAFRTFAVGYRPRVKYKSVLEIMNARVRAHV